MTKAEYKTVLNYCQIRCEPKEGCGEDCPILKRYKEIYGDKEA